LLDLVVATPIIGTGPAPRGGVGPVVGVDITAMPSASVSDHKRVVVALWRGGVASRRASLGATPEKYFKIIKIIFIKKKFFTYKSFCMRRNQEFVNLKFLEG
jgi:hypothetical protein